MLGNIVDHRTDRSWTPRSTGFSPPWRLGRSSEEGCRAAVSGLWPPVCRACGADWTGPRDSRWRPARPLSRRTTLRHPLVHAALPPCRADPAHDPGPVACLFARRGASGRPCGAAGYLRKAAILQPSGAMPSTMRRICSKRSPACSLSAISGRTTAPGRRQPDCSDCELKRTVSQS